MHFSFTPTGVCSKRIDLEIEDGVVLSCAFTNGCSGNGQGIGALVQGRKAKELIPLLSGITCEGHTSCPAQLAIALQEFLQAHPQT